MLFNSYIFILLFLPLSLAGYFFLNGKGKYEWGKTYLVAMSLWFYAWFNIRYLPIITGSILINYGLYRKMLRNRELTDGKKRNLYVMAAGVSANLGVLFYYKYFDFFLENINILFRSDFPLQRLVLPLGISFFTFQQVGFLADTYREETGRYSFMDYAAFVTFFPQLIAGPIVSHDEMIGQFCDMTRKRWEPEWFAKGMYAFTCGLGKKVLIADIFGKAVSWGFGNVESLSGITAVWLMLSYTVQLYFDFSGYCDMARGIGLMFHIEIPLNFNSPYKALHLIEFWKRWHITLNRFFTRYVYIPLGGSRKGKLRTAFNIFMIYLVSGIWHGAGWTYVCWGAMHGAVYVFVRRFVHTLEKFPKVLLWVGNMVFFVFSLVFFRAETLGQAIEILKKTVWGGYGLRTVPEEFLNGFQTKEFFYLLKIFRLESLSFSTVILPVCYMAAAWFILLCCKNVNEKIQVWKPDMGKAFFVAVILLWSVISFSEVSTFLYFNF